ncbi:Dynein light chain [Globisporangium polare]
MQQGVDFSGWGSKQGSKVKTWKKRFFVLRGRELVYYSGGGGEEKGRLTVVGADFAPDLKHGLLVRGEKKHKMQVLKMKTATADESKAWLLKLRAAVSDADAAGANAHLSASFRSRSVSGSTNSSTSNASSGNFMTQASRGPAMTSQASYHHSQRSLSEPKAAGPLTSASSSGEYYANSSDEKRGWLLKEGSKVKSWKKRFFVLRGNVLTYYESETSSPKLGALVVRDIETNFTTPFTLDVHAEGGRLLRIAADSLQDIESWDQALTQAIANAATGGGQAAKQAPQEPPMLAAKNSSSLESFDSFRDYGKVQFRAQDSRLFDDDDDDLNENAGSFETIHEDAATRRPTSLSSSYASQQQLRATSGSNFTSCEGWLLKQGRVSKQWKRRFFTLTNDQLEYRHAPEDFPNEDEVIVDAHFESDSQQGDCVHIELDSGRTITVAAESPAEFERWAQVFSELTDKPFKPEPEFQDELGLYADAFDAEAEDYESNNDSVVEAHAIEAKYADEAYDAEPFAVAAEPVAITAVEPEIKYGWLLKQGSLIKSWKRRYFVLESDHLQYFDNIDKPARGGGIVARVLRDGDNDTVGENCLDVHLASGRILKVSAESQSELSSWYNALLNASRLLPSVENHAADSDLDNNNSSAPRLQKKLGQEGWLLKKGQNFKTWKQRYFVLERSRLVYYASDLKDHGELLGSGVVFEVAVGDARPLCLDIRFQNGRLLQVVAADQTQFGVWLHALQNASNLTESFLSQHDEDGGPSSHNSNNAVFDDEFDLDFGEDDAAIGDDFDWTSNQVEHDADEEEDKGGYSTWAAAMENKPEWDRSDSYGSSISGGDEDDKGDTAEPLSPTPTDDTGRASTTQPHGGCSGWLNKEGGKIRTWKRRYFSLHGTTLRYFKSESGKFLSSYTITRVEEKAALPLGLEVTTTTDRTLVLTAESKEDFAKWLSGMQDAIRAAGAIAGTAGGATEVRKTSVETSRLSVPSVAPALKSPVAKPRTTPATTTSSPVSAPVDVGPVSTVSATVNLEGKTVTSYSGWLEKEGQRFKTWKRRYFTYKKGALLYFNEIGGVAHGHGLVTDVRVDASKPFTLSITLEGERELRVSADSAQEMDTWLHVLSSDISQAPRKSETEALGCSSVASSVQSQADKNPAGASAAVMRGEAHERISDRLDPNDYLTNDTISNESFLRIQEGHTATADASFVEASFNTGRPYKGDLDFTTPPTVSAAAIEDAQAKDEDRDHTETKKATRMDSEGDLEYYRSLLVESEIEREKREAEKGVNSCAACCVVM